MNWVIKWSHKVLCFMAAFGAVRHSLVGWGMARLGMAWFILRKVRN